MNNKSEIDQRGKPDQPKQQNVPQKPPTKNRPPAPQKPKPNPVFKVPHHARRSAVLNQDDE